MGGVARVVVLGQFPPAARPVGGARWTASGPAHHLCDQVHQLPVPAGAAAGRDGPRTVVIPAPGTPLWDSALARADARFMGQCWRGMTYATQHRFYAAYLFQELVLLSSGIEAAAAEASERDAWRAATLDAALSAAQDLGWTPRTELHSPTPTPGGATIVEFRPRAGRTETFAQ